MPDNAIAMTLLSAPEEVGAGGAYSFFITSRALGRIHDLTREKKTEKQFRIRIEGGGCSGFQYRMNFDNAAPTGDWIYTAQGVEVIIDNASIPFLSGTVLDFESSMMNSLFTLKNPNAKSGCGCGNSFSPI